MTERVFLAGASGAIGRRLVPLLVSAGHSVVGATRDAGRVRTLEQAGATAVVVDVYDEAALVAAVASARPSTVMHQLTDLPYGLKPALMAQARSRNARLRRIGTQHLVRAAALGGAKRLIAQSIAWVYASGAEPHTEDDPLTTDADAATKETVEAVAALEALVLGSAGLEGIVLRYGQFYGPGTGSDAPRGACPLHVDAAAHAALLALQRGRPGVYNVAEDNAHVSTAKAKRELGFDPAFRMPDTA